MKEVPLTRGYVALVDDEDYERVGAFKWYVNQRESCFYAMRRTPNNAPRHLMHRFLLGISDSKIWVDHIDGNGLNNQRSNLRIATRGQNLANSTKRNASATSRFKGVHFCSTWKVWIAKIRVHGKRISLGTFHDEESAARAYDRAARKHFGEFAKPNFKEK